MMFELCPSFRTMSKTAKGLLLITYKKLMKAFLTFVSISFFYFWPFCFSHFGFLIPSFRLQYKYNISPFTFLSPNPSIYPSLLPSKFMVSFSSVVTAFRYDIFPNITDSVAFMDVFKAEYLTLDNQLKQITNPFLLFLHCRLHCRLFHCQP